MNKLVEAAQALVNAIDDGRPVDLELQMLRKELSIPQESGWQFKTVGFQTVTLPGGRNEIQFSLTDADAPKGWSDGH